MRSDNLNKIEQPQLPLCRRAEKTTVPVELVLKQSTMAGAIALCVQLSGLEEKEIYMVLGIDAGHWTRIMKGDAHFPVNKLNDLMDLCGNEAPIFWMAHSRGYGLVLLKSEAERRAEQAEARAKEAEDKLKFLTQIMQGKVSA